MMTYSDSGKYFVYFAYFAYFTWLLSLWANLENFAKLKCSLTLSGSTDKTKDLDSSGVVLVVKCWYVCIVSAVIDNTIHSRLPLIVQSTTDINST